MTKRWAPKGWYRDPSGLARFRYWTGARWSEWVLDSDTPWAQPRLDDHFKDARVSDRGSPEGIYSPPQVEVSSPVESRTRESRYFGAFLIWVGALLLVVVIVAAATADTSGDWQGYGVAFFGSIALLFMLVGGIVRAVSTHRRTREPLNR